MADLMRVVHPLVNALALILAVAAVTIWSARLEHRVAGLEASVQALAPAPAAPAKLAMSAQEACANLAVRVAEARQKPDRNNTDAPRQLLREAGCPSTAVGQK